jgi:3-deoxy-manno-octulosonate cytidylyltransferase (CMP-KDO synthetase)
VEQHGNNHPKKVFAIIPARYLSTRLEGKLLLPLNGKPLILHTVEQAKKARNIDKVIVATDDERILQIIIESGNEAILTSKNHQSGSDRIAEVAENLPANSIIVNVQGDEPTIPPSTIEAAVEAILTDENANIATTCEKIEDFRDVLSPDVVKVVTDNNGYALYFSRSPIPFPREAVKKYGGLENALREDANLISLFRKHTGLYVYRREYLLEFTRFKQTNLEKTEMLEQLRALENGAKIKVVEVVQSSIGVDTAEDFERVKMLFEDSAKEYQKDNFIFRRATLYDLPSVAKVYVASSQNAFSGLVPQNYLESLTEEKEKGDFWKTYLKTGYQIFIAQNEKAEIIGFVDFEEMPTGVPFDFKLNSLYVLPDFQRKGVGNELFALAVKEIIFQGKTSMVLEALEISPFNNFYDKKGGEIVGFINHKLANEDFKCLVYGWKDVTKL